MCLIVNRFRHWQLKPKVAKKDIVCYKILSVYDFLENESTSLYTSIRRIKITASDIRTCFTADSFDYLPRKYSKDYCIDKGIHTYKKTNRYFYYPESTIIVKCYIPRGTKYWIGKENDYCSELIKFCHY